MKQNHVEVPIKYGLNIRTNKNSRNNSKKMFIANKSMNMCEKNKNINSLTNLNCYKGRNKSKVGSEKALAKDKLNISGINFFNNIPAIQITQKTPINTNVFSNNKNNENNNILKDDSINEYNYKCEKEFFSSKNVASSILDFNSNEKKR